MTYFTVVTFSVSNLNEKVSGVGQHILIKLDILHFSSVRVVCKEKQVKKIQLYTCYALTDILTA